MNEDCGRRNETVIPVNIKKIFKIAVNERKLKLRELANIVNRLKERAGFILYEHLIVGKLCSKWLSGFITVAQKYEHVHDSETRTK